jgi:RNA polymerase sigma factor (sigma-70 family)
MEAYERYGRALIRKAERILGSRADAEDIVQGFFVDMLEKPDNTMDLPYLYRAITHRCLSHVRDEKNRERLLARNTDVVVGGARTRCDERAIDMDLLLKLSRELPDDTLTIMTFRFFDDMTQEEIATLLDISRKTVGHRLDDVRTAVARLSGDASHESPRETEKEPS